MEVLTFRILIKLAQLGIKLGLLAPNDSIKGYIYLNLADAEVKIEDDTTVLLNSEALARTSMSSLKVVQA